MVMATSKRGTEMTVWVGVLHHPLLSYQKGTSSPASLPHAPSAFPSGVSLPVFLVIAWLLSLFLVTLCLLFPFSKQQGAVHRAPQGPVLTCCFENPSSLPLSNSPAPLEQVR